MMGKRKHNQSSVAGIGQTEVPPSSKRAKVDPEQSLVASPDPQRHAPDTAQTSAKSEQDTTAGLSKSARKRLRKRQAFRDAKKPLSADTSEQATKEPGGHGPSKKPLADPVSGKSKVTHTKDGSKSSSNSVVQGVIKGAKVHIAKSRSDRPPHGSKSSNNGTVKPVKAHVAKTRSDRPPPATSTTISKKSASKSERSDSVKPKPALQQPNVNASQVATKASPSAKSGFSKKRERRRQKLALLKRDKASNHEPASKRERETLDHNALAREIPTSSAEGSPSEHESPNNSILQHTTQTTLLPMPRKQWIDEAEQESTVPDADLRAEVTQTSLMPRPIKEWVEEDVLLHADDLISKPTHDADGPEDTSANATDSSSVAAERTSMRSSLDSSAHNITSSSPKDPQPTEAERPFATVGLPPITRPSATRPGINTIASFSLSSRRHPVDVLAKSRKISGLSGMRMDTGSVGSVNKPVSSLKASSVPSYSGRGDVKAAFAAFNKFAHGGESSDSDDESEESESEVEVQAKKPVASNAAAAIVASPVTTEVRAPQNSQDDGAGQPDSTAHTDNSPKSESNSSAESSDGEDVAIVDADQVSKSHATKENDECVAETPPNSNPNDLNTFDGAHADVGDASTGPSNNASRMLGQQDLPLFGDFKAKHDMQLTDDPTERPATFLEQDLGANISGSGPDPSPIDDDQLTSSLQVPFGDYQASQEADDLYRSIEDISREVFGSTRTLPDCKPPSNPLDATTEPFVTNIPSGHGVKLQSLQQKTPDKDVALRHIARGSSPMVYIVGGVDVGGEAIPDVDGGRLGDDDNDERDTEGGPVLVDKKAEAGRYSSPQSSLSTLTASPTPIDGSPSHAKTSTLSTHDEEEKHEDLKIEPLDGPAEADESIGAAEKKKRKMTGTSSKHFSPRKQPSRQTKTPVKPDFIDDAKPSIIEEVEDHPELSLPSDDLPKAATAKKKGTGKTSEFFTPTSSPVKPTTAPKSKSKTPRPPAGTSTCPVPPTTSAHFGLIQEKLWQTPFWLLIAVTFLNKTTGRSAVPIFRSLQTLYPTPEDLAQADHEDLVELIATLGLQNQRAKKLVMIAKTWCENPPVKGRRYRCLHYPNKGDGKEYKKDEVIEDDDMDENEEEDGSSDDVRGALEIAHIPGCGPYAWDSWRIFCRDILCGRAEDYNGKGAADCSSFVPEWQRVLPLDKELRACLRWMWLREGWVWDCESGSKRAATEEERRAGELGEMSFGDEAEEKFARDAVAAAVGDGDVEDVGKNGLGNDDMGEELVENVVVNETIVPATPAAKKTKTTRSQKMSIARRELDVMSGDEIGMSSLRRSRSKRTG